MNNLELNIKLYKETKMQTENPQTLGPLIVTIVVHLAK